MSKCTCETGETCPVHCSYILKLEAENAKLREIIAECADDFAAASDGAHQCAVELRAALRGWLK